MTKTTKTKIHHTCSLGSRCHSTQLLKRNAWKEASYPFDWIMSNHKSNIHCIENDFKLFLDKSQYVDITSTQCGHRYYDAKMFYHHNPLRYKDDYNYYCRCIKRFKDLLQLSEHKLFIMIFVNGEYNSHLDSFPKEIVEFNTRFSKHTSNYTLLVIIHHPNKQQNSHTFTTYKNNDIDSKKETDDNNNSIHLLELHTLSVSNGVEFVNKNDNVYLDNILKMHYNFLKTNR